MKLLSIVVPSYNSQDYLERCVDSLMIGDEDVEVLIVDDGSTDRTGEIADAYEAKYPGIVRAIHKENGGHGSAVNTGLEQAKGLYFKVVDSDDWVKYSAFKQILDALRSLTGGEKVLDMLISNFVYEKEGAKRKKVVAFRNALPENTMFTWDEVRHFHKSQNILMHSVIYRTKLLKDCGLKLPEHTFYVDNIFVFEPLPYVRNMYYMDVNFYRYYIGREDQSVNEKVMIGRIDQQIKVNKMMVDYYVSTKIPNEKTAKYMLKYLDIITTVSSIMLILAETEEALEKKDELWKYIKEKDKRLFLKMRLGFLGGTMNLPGKGGRKMSEGLYRLARRFVQFN
ncbi:MAG: glycosyltransferase family 2 protein [Lachnospiraceae bacterium]|nr:glycosyltransferase family 2 protein [Lachnospiraceae bacterium]